MIPYTPYKIPLKNRLDAVKIGHVIDPAYFPAAVDRMEKIPISAYLSGFDKEKERLLNLLCLTEEEQQGLTYRQVAQGIHNIRSSSLLKSFTWIVDEVVQSLAAPMLHCYGERKEIYEKAIELAESTA